MFFPSGALLSASFYLFTWHITRNKIIAGVALVVVLVIALVVWLVRRRSQSQTRA